MTARVSDASLSLEVALLHHLFRVVAGGTAASSGGSWCECASTSPCLYPCGLRAPTSIPPSDLERKERLDVPFEVLLVQRRLAVGEALPLEDVTQPRIFCIVETHCCCSVRPGNATYEKSFASINAAIICTYGWSTRAGFSVKHLDEECDACTLCGTTMRDFLHLVERTSPMVGPPRPNFQSRIWTRDTLWNCSTLYRSPLGCLSAPAISGL